jgi:pimeloyl-ACP methyl ester carboxylesterase
LLLGVLTSVAVTVLAFLVHVSVRYGPIIGRIFEEKPMFLPLRTPPEPGGENVRFTTDDGLELAGTYFRATTPERSGVLVFCHEFLSDRWSFHPYANPLRALGFDVFTLDFRSHGDSALDPNYFPLQWVTDHEVNDLKAALRHLRTRPDHDPSGFGLLGISRGGGAALVVGSQADDVWGVITDGAFPTRGTMLTYILRWAEIYVSNRYLWKWMPLWVFRFAGWVGRVRSERRLNCRYPDVEDAVGKLAPRAWLMIHGGKDAYIVPQIAHDLFALAGEPKACWIVPRAKHNRCREVDPEAYLERLSSFLAQYAPRRALVAADPTSPPVADARDVAPALQAAPDVGVAAASLSGVVPSPVSG